MLEQLVTFDDLHEVVEALTIALDAKNSYMCGHSERVADIAQLLCEEMGLPREQQLKIHVGAHLHDIGKIGVPDYILDKQGKLTPAEFEQIKQHPVIGDHIVGRIKAFHNIADIVRYHHERFDGRGYPDGLAGREIPLGARIVAVADSLDAMTTTRVYRKPVSLQEALDEIWRCQGGQFDPEIVAVCMRLRHDPKLQEICLANHKASLAVIR